MTNIYWPIYKNIEEEIIKISYIIHIDDNQLNVYSSQISSLILKASAEIESISKELYKDNGGTKTTKIRYDVDALEFLDNLWILNKKIVIISSYNSFQSIRKLQPFVKSEISSFHKKATYSWNNSYQNLKHDRANSLHFGSLKYLFDIAAALFVLNLYYKNEIYKLEKDSKATNFPINMGSELFSIKLHKWFRYDAKLNYGKKQDFDECIYLTKYTKQTFDTQRLATEEMFKKQSELFSQHPKFHKYFRTNTLEDYKGNNFMYDVLGEQEYYKIIKVTSQYHAEAYKSTEYEAILNKNNI